MKAFSNQDAPPFAGWKLGIFLVTIQASHLQDGNPSSDPVNKCDGFKLGYSLRNLQMRVQ